MIDWKPGKPTHIKPSDVIHDIKKAIKAFDQGNPPDPSLVIANEVYRWILWVPKDQKENNELPRLKREILSLAIESKTPEEAWDKKILPKLKMDLDIWIPLPESVRNKSEKENHYKRIIFLGNQDILNAIVVCFWGISKEVNEKAFLSPLPFPSCHIIDPTKKLISTGTLADTGKRIEITGSYEPEDLFCRLNYLQASLWETLTKMKALTTRLDKQKIRRIDEVYFHPDDIDYLIDALLNSRNYETKIRRYPDQGTLTEIRERKLDKYKTLYVKFSEIPIGLEGEVPSPSSLVAKVLINTIKIAMIEGKWDFVIRKKDQLNLMGYNGVGDEFKRLAQCQQTLACLSIGIIDKRYPNEPLCHRMLYNAFDPYPGKGGGFDIGLNPRAWPVLERFFENPSIPPKPYVMLPGYLDQKGIKKEYMQLISYLRKYRGLGKRLYSVTLKTLFQRIDIYPSDIKARGIPKALEKLNKCLEFARENRELISWQYLLSDESRDIIENISGAVIKRESIQKDGPLWLSKRLKDVHKKLPEIVKGHEEKGIKIPRKLDSFDVYHNWKIKLHLGDKEQKELPLDKVEIEESLPQKEDLKLYEKIDEIVKWYCLPKFRRESPSGKIRSELMNMIPKYGIGFVWDVFQQTLHCSKPHPNEFWRRINEQK